MKTQTAKKQIENELAAVKLAAEKNTNQTLTNCAEGTEPGSAHLFFLKKYAKLAEEYRAFSHLLVSKPTTLNAITKDEHSALLKELEALFVTEAVIPRGKLRKELVYVKSLFGATDRLSSKTEYSWERGSSSFKNSRWVTDSHAEASISLQACLTQEEGKTILKIAGKSKRVKRLPGTIIQNYCRLYDTTNCACYRSPSSEEAKNLPEFIAACRKNSTTANEYIKHIFGAVVCVRSNYSSTSTKIDCYVAYDRAGRVVGYANKYEENGRLYVEHANNPEVLELELRRKQDLEAKRRSDALESKRAERILEKIRDKISPAILVDFQILRDAGACAIGIQAYQQRYDCETDTLLNLLKREPSWGIKAARVLINRLSKKTEEEAINELVAA